MSQPALSQSLSEVARRLDAPLFEAEGKRRGDLIPVDALAFDFGDLTTSSVRLCSVASACRGKPSSSAAMRPSSWPSLRRTAASRVASLPFCHRKFGHS